MHDLFAKMRTMCEKAEKVLLVSHRSPDGDTLGAAVALRIWLGDMGKSVTLACVDKPTHRFDFMPHISEYVKEFDLKDFDLMIVVDAGASYMTNFHLKYENFFKSGLPMINLDHHGSNDNFGDLNIVDPEAPSATVILYRYFKFLKANITTNMATALLAGIYNDTGSFKHSNTTKEVYEISADLMLKGADIKKISDYMFNNNSVPTLKLWGKVLENSYLTDDKVVMSVIKENDFKEVGAAPGDLSGVIDYLNMVPKAKFSVLVNEDGKGHVKGSMRTKSDVDLTRIAAVFGGGGHPKASGFRVPGRLSNTQKFEIISPDETSKKPLDF